MNNNLTFSIIKPDAVGRGDSGRIIARITDAGFRITGLRMVHMTPPQAEAFYAVHRERPFYSDLVTFMTSGPVIVLALIHSDAVEAFRTLIGATDPSRAAAGTIRAEFGTGIQTNAVHGSDSPENALREVSFFFSATELF